ncbi:acyl-CoA synthetase (AMP-forming)/AMP-acid ligase II [Hoeflea marina]|uniref:Acyl-CoA synthetase (AMP-forming)/AMP-acid ligase II n=1 Tax=Hoeflea marina TaxID=274592 RepID=A0A317PTC8_9HYPH|nr:class I adenylate-forming enzyme family protein [Hoeflea marina]PWW03496.1 acyl-CoA synthetase (AMP-forming)/AMP-acid ligase II [Hoeflea marina]
MEFAAQTEDAGLGTRLYRALSARSGDVVVETAERMFTGADLLRRAAGVARVLSAAGLGKGGRAVICLPAGDDALTCILACWHLAATPVPMDFRSPAGQRRQISELVGAHVVVEPRRPAGAEGYESLIWNEAWCEGAAVDAAYASNAELNDVPAYLAFSSGTTGLPKTYVQSHRRMAGRMLVRLASRETAGARSFTPMTLAFSATRNMVTGALLSGGVVRFGPPLFSTGELIEMIDASRASVVALPPPLIRNMLREIGPRSTPYFSRLSSLRSIGGPASAEDKIGAYTHLSNGYLMSYGTGLTGNVSLLSGPDVLTHPQTVGRAVASVGFEIVDPETLRPLGRNVPGLIKIITPWLADDVIEDVRPGAIAERRGEGWGIPGDVGMLDDEGFLTILGREADMIVRGGVNVAPQEIENLLRRDPRITDIGVTGIDDPSYGQEIAAFIVAASGEEADFHALCMQLLSYDRRPRIIRLVSRLPYNVNGKLLRGELAAML